MSGSLATAGQGPSSVNDSYTAPHNIIRGTYPQLIAFLVLNIWPAYLGMPVLLAILCFSKGVKRHPTLANLLAAFIVIGISKSLLIYANAVTGPEPAPIVCLLQTSLLYGMPTLASATCFMLVWQMFLRIRTAQYCKPYQDEDHAMRVWVMLVTPWILFFVPVLVTAVVGARLPDRISRNRRFFYCSLDFDPLTNGIAIASALVLFAAIVMISWSIVILFCQRAVRFEGGRLKASMDLSFPIRIMIFGVYVAFATSLSLLSVTSPSTPVPELALASAGTMIILIFGTQRDTLQALRFWKRNRVVQVECDISTPNLCEAFEETGQKRWKA